MRPKRFCSGESPDTASVLLVSSILSDFLCIICAGLSCLLGNVIHSHILPVNSVGQSWSKLVKVGQSWSKLVRVGQSWSNSKILSIFAMIFIGAGWMSIISKCAIRAPVHLAPDLVAGNLLPIRLSNRRPSY